MVEIRSSKGASTVNICTMDAVQQQIYTVTQFTGYIHSIQGQVEINTGPDRVYVTAKVYATGRE